MRHSLQLTTAFHFLFLLIFLCSTYANNLQVDNVRLTGQQAGAQYTLIEFDLSWENSWRLAVGPSNWDAAWVFAKFRVNNGPWNHASLNYVNGSAAADGHTEPIGSTITTSSDGVGIFIHRANIGSGDVDWKGIQLRWNYGVDGVANNDLVDVQVFAIEMVYVPQGAFRLGGGNGSEVGRIHEFTTLINTTKSYQITSEAAIPVNNSPGNLWYLSPSAHDAGDQGGPIPSQFPKGFNAFYCMKYEVSQSQWIAFFNHLTPAQQVNNDITDLDHRGPNPIDRNQVEWEGTGGAYTTNPYVPLSFPLWGEVMAYCDWAGLRPMSEFEFVKACRGNKAVVPNEYAWGTPDIIDPDFTYDLLEKGSADELLVNPISGTGNANWWHSAIFEDGPYRCGIFAASATILDRETAGATFYGIMEMSGNLSEMCITIGHPSGRAFKGIHGDGVLDANGEADVVTWPLVGSNPQGEGGGLFGGSWFSQEECLWINDRRSATIGDIGYFNDVGFRCVRSAP